MIDNNHNLVNSNYKPADTDNFSTAPIAPRPDRQSAADAPAPTLSVETITAAARIFQSAMQQAKQATEKAE